MVSDAAIGSGPTSDSSVGVAVEGEQAWVLHDDGATRTLIEIDLLTGQRTILADEDHGAGPWITALPWQLVLEGDRILISTGDLGGFGTGSVIAVDRATGDRTIVSDPVTGTGPALEIPSDMTVDGSRVLVSDLAQAIIAVDLVTGGRTVMSM